MNIHDVKDVPDVDPGNYMEEIFKRQQGLLDKYQEIEGIPSYPFDVDGTESQIWLKDFLWRTCEEIAESMEAKEAGHLEHQIEELADSLHFIVEALILAGITPDTIKEKYYLNFPWIWDMLDEYKSQETYEEACLDTFKWAGLTGNTLKNKKWKQSQMQTDVTKFTQNILATLHSVIACFRASGCTMDEVYVYYFKKSEVNKFRQRTKY